MASGAIESLTSDDYDLACSGVVRVEWADRSVRRAMNDFGIARPFPGLLLLSRHSVKLTLVVEERLRSNRCKTSWETQVNP